MASCHSPSELPPSPMNEKATRPACLSPERQRHARHRERSDGQRRGRRQHAPLEVAGVQVLAAHRRAGLAHLRAQDHRHGVVVAAHRQRDPEIADHRRDDVAGPGAVGAAESRAALQPDAGGVDRLLAKRAEALALERLHAPAHFPAGEELLEPVVDGARQAHPAQDLLALVVGERRGDRFTLQPAVARVEHLRPRLFEAANRRHALAWSRRAPRARSRRDRGGWRARDGTPAAAPRARRDRATSACRRQRRRTRRARDGPAWDAARPRTRRSARRAPVARAAVTGTGHGGSILAGLGCPGFGATRKSAGAADSLQRPLKDRTSLLRLGWSRPVAPSGSCSRTPPSSDPGRSCTSPDRSSASSSPGGSGP